MKSHPSRARKACQWLSAALACALLAACAPKVDARGHMRIAETLPKLEKGKTTKEDVVSLLGTPSSRASFGEETWYYVSHRKEAVAFLKPSIVNQEVLSLTFDEAGIIKSMEHYGMEDGVKVAIAKDKTPTEGHSMGVLEQLLGNFGKFNRSQQQMRD